MPCYYSFFYTSPCFLCNCRIYFRHPGRSGQCNYRGKRYWRHFFPCLKIISRDKKWHLSGQRPIKKAKQIQSENTFIPLRRCRSGCFNSGTGRHLLTAGSSPGDDQISAADGQHHADHITPGQWFMQQNQPGQTCDKQAAKAHKG